MRIAIIGGPGTGKTTLGKKLAEKHSLPYRSTDEVIDLGWSESSEEVAKWLNDPEWVIEGVTLIRALRKWRKAHPDEPAPVDKLVRTTQQYRVLSKKGERSMTKGHDSVLKELDEWLPRPTDPDDL